MKNRQITSSARRLLWVDLAQMRISDRAQRDHAAQGAQNLIDKIVQNFDPDRFGALTVNYRDDLFWVVDGGHRLSALLKMGYGDQQVQCWVYEGLTEDQEADLFLDLNNVRPVSSMDKFKVAVVAGREVETAVESIVSSLGMSVGTGRVNTIRCTSALLKLYDVSGPDVLKTALWILRDAYGDAGFTARLVEGMGKFVANYDNRFNEKRLVAKLSRRFGGVNGLLGRAEQIKSSYSVSLAIGVAAATVETYNAGRGGGNLPSWWATIEKNAESDGDEVE